MEFTHNNLMLLLIGLLTALNLGAAGFYLLVLRRDIMGIRMRLDELEAPETEGAKAKDPFQEMLEQMRKSDPEKEKRAEAAKDAYLSTLRSEPLVELLTPTSRESTSKADIQFDGQALTALTGCQAPNGEVLKTYNAPIIMCLALMEAGRMDMNGSHPTWRMVCDFLEKHTPMRTITAIVQASLVTNKELFRLSRWSDGDQDNRNLDLAVIARDYPEVNIQHGGDDIRTVSSLVQAMLKRGAMPTGHPLVAACDKHEGERKSLFGNDRG